MNLRRIRVDQLGTFVYTCANSIEHNLTTMLFAANLCQSVKEALKARKEYTLCRDDGTKTGFEDLRCFSTNAKRIKQALAADSARPWTLRKLDELYDPTPESCHHNSAAITKTKTVELDDNRDEQTSSYAGQRGDTTRMSSSEVQEPVSFRAPAQVAHD